MSKEVQTEQEYEVRRVRLPKQRCLLCFNQADRLTSMELCASCSKELGPVGRAQFARDVYP